VLGLVTSASGNLKIHPHETNQVCKNITEIRRLNGCESAPTVIVVESSKQAINLARRAERFNVYGLLERTFLWWSFTKDHKSTTGRYPDLRQTNLSNC
jgi:hypothetical protein